MKNKRILLCLIMVLVLVMTGSTSVFAITGDNVTIVAETTDGAVETPAPEEEPDPPSIIIENYPATLEVGETDKLSYVLRNSDEKSVNWKSGNPDILSIDADGKITANAAGTAKITVTAGKATDSVEITVKEVPAESISIVSSDFSVTDNVTGHKLKKGDSVKLDVKVKPKNAVIGDVEWSVDDNEIAEIDSGGTLIALKNGKVTVTATVDDLEAEIEIQIGSDIPWALIAIAAVILIIIIVLIVLIIKMKRRSGPKPKKAKSRKYDDNDDEYEDDDKDDYRDDAKMKQDDLEKEKERIRREAYRQGFSDRDKEMTKVFDPKDFEFKDDDDIE